MSDLGELLAGSSWLGVALAMGIAVELWQGRRKRVKK